VLKRAVFEDTPIDAGDLIEIVNFVGGGACARHIDP
jgi:sulfur carrier protein ThiS